MPEVLESLLTAVMILVAVGYLVHSVMMFLIARRNHLTGWDRLDKFC